VCSIDVEGTCGVPSLNPNLEWDLAAVPGSTLSSTPAPPKGANVTFAFTGLPTQNSLFRGGKILSLEYPGSGCGVIAQEIRVFFSKKAENNPGGTSPNWYYYWSQTSASVGPHTYNSHTTDPGGHCAWDGTAWRAYICKNAENDDIDRFAYVCRHEAQHVEDFTSWWPAGVMIPGADNDGVPDNLEVGLGYDPALSDTDGDGHFDAQDHAIDNQDAWTYGAADAEDWANPGKQW
jgi:hypothetical protein